MSATGRRVVRVGLLVFNALVLVGMTWCFLRSSYRDCSWEQVDRGSLIICRAMRTGFFLPNEAFLAREFGTEYRLQSIYESTAPLNVSWSLSPTSAQGPILGFHIPDGHLSDPRLTVSASLYSRTTGQLVYLEISPAANSVTGGRRTYLDPERMRTMTNGSLEVARPPQ